MNKSQQWHLCVVISPPTSPASGCLVTASVSQCGGSETTRLLQEGHVSHAASMWPCGTLLLGMLLLRARPHAVRSPSLMESQCAGTLLTVLAEPSLQATPAQAPDVSVRKLPDASRSKLRSPQPLESFQMRPQAFCTLNNFQTRRIWEHDKWRLLYATKLGLVCYAALSS